MRKITLTVLFVLFNFSVFSKADPIALTILADVHGRVDPLLVKERNSLIFRLNFQTNLVNTLKKPLKVQIKVWDLKSEKYLPIDEEKEYSVVTNKLCLNGPQSIFLKEASIKKELKLTDKKIILKKIKVKKEISPKIDGRILFE